MTDYNAPLADIRFVLAEVAGFDAVSALPGFGDLTPGLAAQVLDEARRLGSEVFAPLNRSGDIQGCVLENGVVRTPDGFADAYRQYAEGGWTGIAGDPDYGGQGLPWLLATAVGEIWASANMAFAVGTTLTQSAIAMLEIHGSAEQKSAYLPKWNSGEWTATMNLTEPQAGSDLGRLRAKAVKHQDHYRLSGQKIFITYGEHDFTDNIVHLVLARTAGAPAGVKGISLFLVPKFLINGDGGLGARNDLRAISLEHKLGIHASPTCVMSYGDDGGADAYLVGEENGGLAAMFTMMNTTRLTVGLQGVGIAERAYQQALAYARERLQGNAAGTSSGGANGEGEAVTIIHHPDVRRMLMKMKAKTEAARALTLFTAAALDHALHGGGDDDAARVGLLTPLVKGWCSEIGIEVASTGIQVHGGAGYIEETGAAQHYRDARIVAIYEGTNGIQAIDLVGRKLARDKGAAAARLIAEMRTTGDQCAAAKDAAVAAMAAPLTAAVAALDDAGAWLIATLAADAPAAQAGAVDYLELMASTVAGWLMARAALAAEKLRGRGEGDGDFLAAKISTARFFAEHILCDAPVLANKITTGSGAILALAEEQF